MGQKVHPYILRIGINKNWRSLWFADRKEYANNVNEDYKIRNYIKKKFVHAAVSYVVIERLAEEIKIKRHHRECNGERALDAKHSDTPNASRWYLYAASRWNGGCSSNRDRHG